jgi:hypothetical protein
VKPAAPSYRFQADPTLGDGFGPGTASILVLTLAFAGAIVGIVHGLALVWLGRSARRL